VGKTQLLRIINMARHIFNDFCHVSQKFSKMLWVNTVLVSFVTFQHFQKFGSSRFLVPSILVLNVLGFVFAARSPLRLFQLEIWRANYFFACHGLCNKLSARRELAFWTINSTFVLFSKTFLKFKINN
jgi:hypothetical protein